MGMFDNIKDKAAELAGEHGDKIEAHSDTGLDRAEQMAGERLGDQHTEHIAQGRDMIDDRIGDDGDATENPA
jgi:hypothetical protein